MFAHIINVLLGVWLMAAPDVLDYGDPARTNDHIVGPLILSFAMIATSEVTRSVRWINLGLGLWVAMAPLPLGYPFRVAMHSVAVGVMVAALSCVRGTMKERLGGGWGVLWRR
ncbi:MAG: SPW repeat domain-containing protein [Nitrospiraceae bacterium]